MRLVVVFFVILVLSVIASSKTADPQAVIAGGQIRFTEHVAPEATAPCGLWVALCVDVVGTSMTVTAEGEEGPDCEWVKLKVIVEMRRTGTQIWDTKPGYNGTAHDWSNQYSTVGYDRFNVVAKSVDIFLISGSSASIEDRCTCLSGEHKAVTSLEEDL